MLQLFSWAQNSYHFNAEAPSIAESERKAEIVFFVSNLKKTSALAVSAPLRLCVKKFSGFASVLNSYDIFLAKDKDETFPLYFSGRVPVTDLAGQR
jgi:hypothetical protein